MWINLGYILSYIRRIKLYSHHHRWSNIISKVPVKRPLQYTFFTFIYIKSKLYLVISEILIILVITNNQTAYYGKFNFAGAYTPGHHENPKTFTSFGSITGFKKLEQHSDYV